MYSEDHNSTSVIQILLLAAHQHHMHVKTTEQLMKHVSGNLSEKGLVLPAEKEPSLIIKKKFGADQFRVKQSTTGTK